MSMQKISTSGHTAYGLAKFVLDTQADLDRLPTDVPMGSTAFIIETSKVYMLNSKGQWKELG